ncbi:antitoxin [Pedococcus sp. NPDC057267]|uniref:antitoxin n=1 Tax=Pedococcus sp. NPDC057267 TaxID=3346077 RepID=UPI003627F772
MLNNALQRARRYAQEHPDKVDQLTQKAANAADRQTKGRYRRQIDSAARKVGDWTGQPPSEGRPGGR